MPSYAELAAVDARWQALVDDVGAESDHWFAQLMVAETIIGSVDRALLGSQLSHLDPAVADLRGHLDAYRTGRVAADLAYRQARGEARGDR